MLKASQDLDPLGVDVFSAAERTRGPGRGAAALPVLLGLLLTVRLCCHLHPGFIIDILCITRSLFGVYTFRMNLHIELTL